MKLNQIEILCKIIELGSFSKAAEALHLSQPTLTEHIKSLEDYFGVALLNRLGREIVPTKAGEIIRECAQKILALKVEAEQKIKSLKGAFKGELLVGASTIPGEFILPSLIKDFREHFPEIFIQIKIGDTKMIIEDVLNNQIELGIVGAKVETPKLEYFKFVKDELMLVGATDFFSTKAKSITLNDLKDIPFVLREEGSGTRMAIEKAFKGQGFSFSGLKIVSILGSTTAVIQAIKNGVGCSILSRRAVQEELTHGSLRTIPIQHVKIRRDFFLVVRRGKFKSPLCEAFFTFLQEKVKTETNLS